MTRRLPGGHFTPEICLNGKKSDPFLAFFTSPLPGFISQVRGLGTNYHFPLHGQKASFLTYLNYTIKVQCLSLIYLKIHISNTLPKMLVMLPSKSSL